MPDTDNYQEDITYESGTLTVLDSAVHVTGVSLDKSALSLSTGSVARLTALLSPENATDKSMSWASNNPAVASVDSSGNITAASAGTAVITVTAADGDIRLPVRLQSEKVRAAVLAAAIRVAAVPAARAVLAAAIRAAARARL